MENQAVASSLAIEGGVPLSDSPVPSVTGDLPSREGPRSADALVPSAPLGSRGVLPADADEQRPAPPLQVGRGGAQFEIEVARTPESMQQFTSPVQNQAGHVVEHASEESGGAPRPT